MEIEVKTDTEVPNESLEKTPLVSTSTKKKDVKSGRHGGAKKWRSSILRISLDGMLTALYIVLTLLKIRIGNIQISFAAIPLCFGALCLGLPDGLVIAFLGSLIEQLVSPYGFTPTTFLWVVPHLLRVLVLFLFDLPFKKKGSHLYDHILIYFIGMIVSAIVLTASNTLVMYLDALIIGYPIELVLIETIIRFVTGMVTATLVSIVLLPLIKVLKKNNKI